jgi:hypothetical protein
VAVEIVVAVRARPRPVESSDVVGLEPSEVVS